MAESIIKLVWIQFQHLHLGVLLVPRSSPFTELLCLVSHSPITELFETLLVELDSTFCYQVVICFYFSWQQLVLILVSWVLPQSSLNWLACRPFMRLLFSGLPSSSSFFFFFVFFLLEEARVVSFLFSAYPLLNIHLLSHFRHVRLCATPQTAAHQAPLSLGFSRQEYWTGLPLPSPNIHLSVFFFFFSLLPS